MHINFGFLIYFLPLVAIDVSVKFCLPKFAVVFGKFVVALWTAMPEAAHDKDCGLFGCIGDIWSAGNVLWMESIAAMAEHPQSFSKCDLR